MELYAYASELFENKRIDPHEDLMSVLTEVEMEGEKLNSIELELFFLLLTVAGNETTRNLISGAMAAFFDHPDQWEKLRNDRSLLPSATEEMLRYVSPVMNFRRQTTSAFELGDQQIEADTKVVFFHISANRDETVFDNSADLRHHPGPQSPHRLRRRWAPLLPGRQSGPHGDPGDVRAPPRPDARHRARRRGRAPAVGLHQRGEAHPGELPARAHASRPDGGAPPGGQPERGHPGLPPGPGHRRGPTAVRRAGHHRRVDGRDRRRGRRGPVHRLRVLRQPRRAAAGLPEAYARAATGGHRQDLGARRRARPTARAPGRGHVGPDRRQPGVLPAGAGDPRDREPGR